MSFLADLRKRKVFQVALGYLMVAWLLVQVTATILPAFDLPVWVLRLVVLLFALGFPVAVLMAWALELTPDGVKLDVSNAGGKRMLAIAAVLMALALGWFFRGSVLATQHSEDSVASVAVTAVETERKAGERSVAVLPLVNSSNDPDQQFFSDGLSENLIDSLSRFDGLRVVGRISAFQFRDSKDDSATIGRKLGVTYLLNGSVQRAGGVVRIRTSLTNAADSTTLWTEHYDRPYDNLFALQDEISQAVAHALRVKLLAPVTAGKQDDRPPSGSIEAYNAYLQGLAYWHAEKFSEAAEYMTKAVQLDEDYAMAWAHLSGSQSTAATIFNEPPDLAREHMRIARDASDKALQLAPELGAAHAARAYLSFYQFDYKGALVECRRAVQLAPDDGTVLNGCGYTLAYIGRLDEAIRLRQRLVSIEPLYYINYLRYAQLLMATGRMDEGEKYLGIAEGLLKPTPVERIRVAMLRGDAEAALEIAAQAPPENRDLYTALAAQIGTDRAAADRALSTFLKHKDFSDADTYEIAQIYALRRDADHFIEALERSPEAIFFILVDPIVMRLRDDPHFIAFCKNRGLPPPSESDVLSIDQIRARASSRPER